MPNAEPVITRSELISLLIPRASGEGGAVFFADSYSVTSLVNDVFAERAAASAPDSEPAADTFTSEELTAAMRRMNYAALHAPQIVASIIAHREPEWEPGDIVVSDDRKGYLRTTGGWANFNRDTSYAFDHPMRPLTLIGRVTST